MSWPLMSKLKRSLNEQGSYETNLSPIQLNFSVSNLPFDKQVEKLGRFKVIGKKKNIYLYLLNPENYKLDDYKASQLKRYAVEYLVNSDINLEYSSESIEYISRFLMERYSSDPFLSYIIAHDTVGYGPISILLENSKDIEEILVNGPKSNISIYHAKYGYCETNLKFNGEDEFRFTMNKILSETLNELNEDSPVVDAQLKDGSRIHVQIKPYSENGATASIRLNGSKSIGIRKLLESGTIVKEDIVYLWMGLEVGCNIIISGSPSSGKTTLLTAISALMPRYERIITIEEDVNELKFYSNFINAVNLKSRSKQGLTLKDQVINSLHLRPDRLIIGEIRGPEAHDIFFGANTGIPFITTMHSEADENSLLARLESRPMSVESHLIQSLDIAIFMEHRYDNTRKLSRLVEYNWLSKAETLGDKELPMVKLNAMVNNTIFDMHLLNESKVIKRYATLHGMSNDEAVNEFMRRSKFLEAIPRDTEFSSYIERYWEIK